MSEEKKKKLCDLQLARSNLYFGMAAVEEGKDLLKGSIERYDHLNYQTNTSNSENILQSRHNLTNHGGYKYGQGHE